MIETMKEIVIKQALKKAKKRIENLKSIIYASPVTEIVELRRNVFKTINTLPLDEQNVFLTESAKKEKELFALAKRQRKHSLVWTKEQAKLEFEVSQLNNELYLIVGRRVQIF